jgi:4-amino-4-deoxy-L-arabinose transferase-like glycosyltransferase
MFSAALAGAAIGIAVVTKFTTLVFLPPAAAAILTVYVWPERRAYLATLSQPALWRGLLLGGVVAFATIRTFYGFRDGAACRFA